MNQLLPVLWQPVFLSLVGLLMLLSASLPFAELHYAAPYFVFSKQLIAFGLGLIVICCLLWIPVAMLYYISYPLFVLAIVFVASTLYFGIEIKGSQRWIEFGGFSIQPVEICKLALPLYIAAYCYRQYKKHGNFKTIAILRPFLPLLILCTALLLQPDLGSSILLFGIAIVMLFNAGVPRRVLFILAVVTVIAATVLIFTSDYRTARWFAFLDPWSNEYGSSYQLVQSQIAVGSGGFFGAGLGESIQKHGFIPDAHVDFIFAIVVEELGLVGASVILLVFLQWFGTLMYYSRVAMRKGLLYHAMVLIGIGTSLISQLLIHVTSVLGLSPTKGITMPFFSAGGTSLFICMVMVGVVFRIKIELDKENALFTGLNSA